MKNRYVIFRVFAKNKFANKKEVTGGEILASFNSCEDIARSKFFNSKKDIDNYHKALNGGHRIPSENSYTYEEAKQQLYESILSLIEGRMESIGHMYNTKTDDIYNTESLLKVDFGDKCEPVSFIVLDLENKNKTFNELERKWFREINLINLTE